jgi:hypothetical protein
MFNPTQIVIQAFVGELKNRYGQIYGILEPAYPDIIVLLDASPNAPPISETQAMPNPKSIML